jgi:hypothetical protein
VENSLRRTKHESNYDIVNSMMTIPSGDCHSVMERRDSRAVKLGQFWAMQRGRFEHKQETRLGSGGEMLGVPTTETTNQDAMSLREEVSWVVRLKQTRSGEDSKSDESKTRPKRPLMDD